MSRRSAIDTHAETHCRCINVRFQDKAGFKGGVLTEPDDVRISPVKPLLNPYHFAIALDGADQGRIDVALRMSPFVQRDRHCVCRKLDSAILMVKAAKDRS